MTATLRRARVHQPTHRLIASRYPTVGVFDDLTRDAEDIKIAILLESATNDRLSLLSRRLTLLPNEEIAHGNGATLVMAAFLHASEPGGRFTDHRLGAWYASLDVETAIAETVYHSERRLRLSEKGFPNTMQIRQLITPVDGEHVDIRGAQKSRPELYDAQDYAASRAWGVSLRWPQEGAGADGILYDSVRRMGGVNVCVYRPSLVRLPVTQGAHYEYKWDAGGYVSVVELRDVGV